MTHTGRSAVAEVSMQAGFRFRVQGLGFRI
jgi:hypothetical protein